MTSNARIRAVLEHAAEGAPTIAVANETRVRAAAARRQRVRRRIAVVSTCAAVAAVSSLAVVTPRLMSHNNEQPKRIVAQPLTVGPVAAGEYLLDPTHRDERVRLGAGWQVNSATPGDARLGRAGSSGVVGFSEVTRVYVPGAAMRTAPAHDLVGWLKGHPDLRLVTSHVIRVDAFVGTDLVLRVVAHP